MALGDCSGWELSPMGLSSLTWQDDGSPRWWAALHGPGVRPSQDQALHAENRMVWSPGHTLGTGPAVVIHSGRHLGGHLILPLLPDKGATAHREDGAGGDAQEAGVLAYSYSSGFNSRFCFEGPIFCTVKWGLDKKVFGVQGQRPLFELLVDYSHLSPP